MRWMKLLLLASLLFGLPPIAQAGKARVIKTLQHRLDQQGRHTLSPSLYERDAYQAHLRAHPELVSALRFDIQWSGQKLDKQNLKVRLELRSRQAEPGKPFVIEQPVKAKGFLSYWAAVDVDAETFKKIGDITAWRVVILENGRELAEQKSFLW
jgi:hypothetical protein